MIRQRKISQDGSLSPAMPKLDQLYVFENHQARISEQKSDTKSDQKVTKKWQMQRVKIKQ